MKRLFFSIVCLLLIVWWPLQAAAQEKTITLKLATVIPAKHAYNVGAREFSKRIKELTGGAVDIRVFPGGQLGKGEREVLEGMQIGNIDLAVTATGPISGFCPSMMVLDLPFLFRDCTHVDAVLDSAIGRDLLDDLEKSGLKGLAFFENGFRNFTNSARPLSNHGKSGSPCFGPPTRRPGSSHELG
jgi:TRAP-type C4-dicarboxylate transport system substrate-binding protein